MTTKKAPLGAEFEGMSSAERDPSMEQPVIEMIPLNTEVAPLSPPPLETYINISASTTELKRKVDELTAEKPTEGELERSHEIKHFDEPDAPGASSIGSLLAKIERGSGYGSGGYNQSDATLPSTPLNPPRKAMPASSYRPAIIFGFVAGLGLLVMLLLLGVVR